MILGNAQTITKYRQIGIHLVNCRDFLKERLMTGLTRLNFDELFLKVEKPSRYIGGEVNSLREKGAPRLRLALAFPDAYEVGMSHLGVQILYSVLNGLPDVSCERCYAPWSD